MYIDIKSIPKFYKVQKSISLWLVVNTLHSNVLVLAGHSVEAQNSKLHSTLKRRPPPAPLSVFFLETLTPSYPVSTWSTSMTCAVHPPGNPSSQV